MSEQSVPHVDLEAGLRAYFAVTTPTELPRSISRMNVRSLQERRSSRLASLSAGAFGLILAAVLVFVVLAHPGSQSATSSSSSFGGIAASAGPDVAQPMQGNVVAYPGVDSGKLAASGVVLRVPVGRAAVSLSPAQAQAAAVQAVGGTGAHPGPAVLATVDLLGGQQTTTCLCWVVDVPVSRITLASPGAASQPRTELVLVDAADGRIVATLTGHGIP
jgi:hypothetical protein